MADEIGFSKEEEYLKPVIAKSVIGLVILVAFIVFLYNSNMKVIPLATLIFAMIIAFFVWVIYLVFKGAPKKEVKTQKWSKYSIISFVLMFVLLILIFILPLPAEGVSWFNTIILLLLPSLGLGLSGYAIKHKDLRLKGIILAEISILVFAIILLMMVLKLIVLLLI